MKHHIQRLLAPLASLKYQERYIVHATKDEYVLPLEMLDTAITLIKNTLSKDVLIQNFSARERDALRQVLAVFESRMNTVPFDDIGTTASALVLENQEWSAVRDAAGECLRALRFDLIGWEAENC